MKKILSLTFPVLLSLMVLQSCDKKAGSDSACEVIMLHETFTARFGEKWCIPSSGWSLTLDPFIEDSRCNVPQIECVWQGRFVMGVTFQNGENALDTFDAQYGSQDTLFNIPYSVILLNVKPELRSSMEPLDPAAYSFDLVVH